MTEREHIERSGPGRREYDRCVCALHDLLQDETKDHRKMILDQIKEKANSSDLRGLTKLVAILITICCIVVAGQAVWLRTDISSLANSTHRLNVRLTEATDERVRIDIEQTKVLEHISGQLGTVDWRLTEIEKKQK